MYIRFITQFINENDENDTGIFKALLYLREHSMTLPEDVNELKILNGWFNTYLEKPTKFSNASNKNPASISLSWFKDTAKGHLLKLNDAIEILEKYDFVVERLVTKNPGYIIYEDEYQVSAIPFRKDRNKVH